MMAHETKPLLSDSDEEPPDPGGVSELARHQLQITTSDKAIAGTHAVQGSLGTAGLVANFDLFLCFTSLDQGGMGIVIGSTAAIASIAVVSIITVAITAALSYYAYNSYMKSANKLIQNIEDNEVQRKNYHHKLFIELLKLRCLYGEDEINFNAQVEKLDIENAETKKTALINLVKDVYLDPKFNLAKYTLTSNSHLNETKEVNSETRSLKSILSSPRFAGRPTVIAEDLFSHLENMNSHLQSRINECFRKIPRLPIVKQKTAMGYGAGAFIAMAGVLFGTITSFGQIAITAGIAAALTATGWGAIIVGIVILSLLFATCYGYGKQKNFQREELNKQLENRNKTLNASKEAVTRLCAEKEDQIKQAAAMKQRQQVADLENERSRLQQELDVLKSQHLPEKSKVADFKTPPAVAGVCANTGFFSPRTSAQQNHNQTAMVPATPPLLANQR